MPGPKAKTPAPIDRPLSRAYLRKFKGWSPEFPPGVSDPASLRHMENLVVNRDGTLAIRPGLTMLTWKHGVAQYTWGRAYPHKYIVGTFESFYLNDGRVAHLFASLDTDFDEVQFNVGVTMPDGVWQVYPIDHADIGFTFDTGSPPTFTSGTTYVKYVQIDNKIIALSNNGEPLIVFHVGAAKRVPRIEELSKPTWGTSSPSGPEVYMPQHGWMHGGNQVGMPPAATEHSATSLISSDPLLNDYNYVFFYTYTNELGETGMSDPTQVKAQRPFGNWRLLKPGNVINVATEATYPQVPEEPATWSGGACDQLVVKVPASVAAGFSEVLGQGATGINFYMLTWSNQDSVPVEAQLIGTTKLTGTSTIDDSGWIRLTPVSQYQGLTKALPTADNRLNTTGPARAGQGLVASDRLVLVHDPTAAAVIRWSGNESGNYLNFALERGGGKKTLTHGNMQVPAVAKLWQNPQSADTITVLCKGTDAVSTAYYMAPATVSSQSDATNIMGFEETTATPGTTSPYGCEVANNALYHPLEDQLMKSTASNYNISHKSMTDQISTMWKGLVNKHKIVSCFFDQKIYYLVHNPRGAELQPYCNGNEIWVLDLAAEGTWSRWLVQGVSLKKTDVAGKPVLALIQPGGLCYFDDSFEGAGKDEWNDHTDPLRPHISDYIPWFMETNTQGANRAHDAWCMLQQVSVTTGSFVGRFIYGVKGTDRHGMDRDLQKYFRQDDEPELQWQHGLPFDEEDHLLVQREVKEWSFYAGSACIPPHPQEEPVLMTGPGWQYNDDQRLMPSQGLIGLVQYRYAPISVNIGYEYGSVETFEYGSDTNGWDRNPLTTNGIPIPYMPSNQM